jgi:hypothetical protein
MKLHKWPYIALIIFVFSMCFARLFPRIQDYIARMNIEQFNHNLNFVDMNMGNYAFSKACLLKDGSVLIASTILKEPSTVSLIKLAPDMKFIWERKLIEKPVTIRTLLFQNSGTLTISEIQVINEKCYIYAIQEKEGKYNPVIISSDLAGNLIEYKSISYRISSHTPPKGILMNNQAFFTWYNDTDKMIVMDKIDIEKAKIMKQVSIYLIQDSLRITCMSSNPAIKTVFITTYDPHKGSALLSYNDASGLKILNDTDRYQTLQVVTYVDSTLYAVATMDSSLVVGKVYPDQEPGRIITIKLKTDNFLPSVLVKNKDSFYVGINVANANYGNDVIILKYHADNKKPGEFHIRGKFAETLNQLLFLPNGDMLAIGNSDSHKFGSGSRVFATKFKL